MSTYSNNPNMATMTKTTHENRFMLSRLNYNFGQELRALLEEKQLLLKGTDLLSRWLFPLRAPEGKCKVRDSSYSRFQSILCDQWPRRVECCIPLQTDNTLNSTHPSTHPSIHLHSHPSIHLHNHPLRDSTHRAVESCAAHGGASTSCASETWLLVGCFH